MEFRVYGAAAELWAADRGRQQLRVHERHVTSG